MQLQKYTEPLTESELIFLINKEATERGQYYKTFRMLMILSFIIPFAGAWYRAADGAANAFSPTKFFFSAGVLLFICSVSTYLTYRVNLKRVQLDIHDRTKTIEFSHITRKLHISMKNAYYFYIDSAVKLSIEVTPDFYNSLNEGDEVCIEYATHSRLYLGYF